MSGKIKSIERNANSKRPDLEFGYDAAGNRIYKTVKPRTGSGLTSETEWTTTYYTRDASGNQMAVYEMKTISDPDGTLNDQMQMKEFDIYGSSRLGVYNVPLEQANIAFAPTQNRGYLPSKYDQNSLFLSSTDALVKSYGIGYKFFEQSNHLGNVHTVVSDKKIAIDNNNDGVIDGYMSEVISANDYFSFGSLRPSRSYQSDAYRFGFTGQNHDYELLGFGNSFEFEERYFNSRIGNWYSIDGEFGEYPNLSPYSFGGNNPISNKEKDGNVFETLWDLANVAMDVTSMVSNVAVGNYGAAAVDLAGLAADAAATLVPGVPGGAGYAIKAGRAGAKLADNANDAKKVTKIVKEGANQVEKKVVNKSLQSQRQKAVKEAWKQEKKLVEETGRGTKKWTAAQKKELLENGKVKGQEGHHINNVKDHPDKAGDPNNIEFVTRKEHLQKHNGNFKNKTTGQLKNRTVKKP